MDYDASLSDEFVFIDPDHLDCVLAAGDASDVPGLRAWCSELPADSYGQIFIEAFDASQIEDLKTPSGVGVTWIMRSAEHDPSDGRSPISRCQALATAVDGWLDEWVRASFGPERHFLIWTGARTSPIMRRFWIQVEDELASAWTSGQPSSATNS